MKDDLREDGYIDLDARTITLPREAYRLRNWVRAISVLPCVPAVAVSVYQLYLGDRRVGVLASIATVICACISLIFYSNLIGKMKFEYLSRDYISNLLMNDAFREKESENAKAAANVRHEANRKRNAEAREMYEGREWPTKAAAARALAAKFSVTSKTAERWIVSWNKG